MNASTVDTMQNFRAHMPGEVFPSGDHHDEEAQATYARAEVALTIDGLSLTVDGVVFWHAGAGALLRTRRIMDRAAQVCLHDAVHRSTLVELLDQQAAVEARLFQELEVATAGTGLSIRAISIARVAIPAALKAAFEARMLRAIDACLEQHAGLGGPSQVSMPRIDLWHGLLSLQGPSARHSTRPWERS
jgi:regulator of protease activity HflC (stomatin/prohibitin superfamily)